MRRTTWRSMLWSFEMLAKIDRWFEDRKPLLPTGGARRIRDQADEPFAVAD